MKKYALTLTTITLGVLVLTAASAQAQITTVEEARTVADNWIRLIVHSTGSWGDSPAASVGEIEELRRGDRLLGFWCHVVPRGHVVVSLRRELAPVKCTSETWDCDPACDVDLVDVAMFKIEQEHDFIEQNAGPVATASAARVEELLEFSYRDAWDFLGRDGGAFEQDLPLRAPAANYLEGGVQLTSHWKQSYPYNIFCPENPLCAGAHYQGRCAVGCVATAAAQIMRYWAWPPYGTTYPYDDPYHWYLMPDAVDAGSPQDEIDAVANLSREVGDACLMTYCGPIDCGSGAWHEDMLDAYENYFRYDDDAFIENRSAYMISISWFNLIKQQINSNRPLQYRVPNHSIVCDGWRENQTVPMWQYHMNYGWDNFVPPDEPCWDPFEGIGSNAWFTLDNLPCSTLDVELMIVALIPDVSLPSTLGPFYGNNPSFPYRYIPLDSWGNSVTFSEGQLIQFLHGVTMRCSSTSGGAIKFYGTPALHTRLFSRGDTSKGVRIENGGIALYGGGMVKLY